MAKASYLLYPFRALRYNLHRRHELSEVICPPYDIISREKQEQLYNASAHNFIRIELTRAESETRYQQAATTLQAWLNQGVMVAEEEPALYILEQTFTAGESHWSRRGVFGLVRIPEGNERHVLAHEQTLAKAKADRLSLLRACHAMTSPVMMMAEDPDGRLIRLLQATTSQPDMVAREAEGVVNRLWIITDAEAVQALREAVGAGPLIIADGHHRFDTARVYRDELRAVHPEADAHASFNYALTLINSAADEGLRVFPTHRLVSGVHEAGLAALEQALTESFTVEEMGPEATASDLSWLESTEPTTPVFGLYLGAGRLFRVVVRERALPVTESIVDRLEVALLHRLLVDPILMAAAGGKAPEGQVSLDPHAPVGPAEPTVAYTTEAVGAAAAVDRGEAEAAFFLRPTRVSDVIAAARKGELMPRKSTYFYPKIPAGLVISDASAEPITD